MRTGLGSRSASTHTRLWAFQRRFAQMLSTKKSDWVSHGFVRLCAWNAYGFNDSSGDGVMRTSGMHGERAESVDW